MVGDYIRLAGGPPDPDMPWHYFVLVVRQAGRYAAHDVLHLYQAVRMGAWGQGNQLELTIQRLQDEASGTKSRIITGT